MIDEICRHMGSKKKRPGSRVIKPGRKRWDLKKAVEDAAPFKTKSEWVRKPGGAYQWARKNGVLDQCCEHMRPGGTWNMETVTAEAKKYTSRYEFYKNSGGAYQWARGNGHLDEVCEHMVLRWSRADTEPKEGRKKKLRGQSANVQNIAAVAEEDEYEYGDDDEGEDFEVAFY
tara:strand:+ start:44 stop:562 length:519 start_codon:yes stop_codon:yes gene_type:complete